MHVPSFAEVDGLRRAHRAANGRAMEHFLLSMDSSMSRQAHEKWLLQDARLFRWGRATIEAIRAGIRLSYYGGRA